VSTPDLPGWSVGLALGVGPTVGIARAGIGEWVGGATVGPAAAGWMVAGGAQAASPATTANSTVASQAIRRTGTP
jgi:hypothetical protein